MHELFNLIPTFAFDIDLDTGGLDHISGAQSQCLAGAVTGGIDQAELGLETILFDHTVAVTVGPATISQQLLRRRYIRIWHNCFRLFPRQPADRAKGGRTVAL